MNNYHFIDFNQDYNMKELSAKKCCENMSLLSKSDIESPPLISLLTL